MKRVERGVCGGIPEESLVDGLDAPRLDLDAAAPPPAAQVDHPLQARRSTCGAAISFAILQAVVEQRSETPVAAPRPRLDRQRRARRRRLRGTRSARLQVPVERREPERLRGHPPHTVPGQPYKPATHPTEPSRPAGTRRRHPLSGTGRTRSARLRSRPLCSSAISSSGDLPRSCDVDDVARWKRCPTPCSCGCTSRPRPGGRRQSRRAACRGPSSSGS